MHPDFTPPAYDCHLCPRLSAFLADTRQTYPDQYNGPVPSFGGLDAELLIVGLAPGLKGANFSGRPFTGDYAGDLLYATLLKFGLATGVYKARKDDGLVLQNTRITNAVRCVPPQNKPLPAEIKTCNGFLKQEIAAMPNLKVILSLGRISHDAVLTALGQKKSAHPFGHNATHVFDGKTITLIDSYHCSRYNTNTGRLTTQMFEAVFQSITARL